MKNRIPACGNCRKPGLRDYNPCLGRWLSRDPMAEDGGANLYSCLRNNAVNYVDALGKRASNPLQATDAVIEIEDAQKIDVYVESSPGLYKVAGEIQVTVGLDASTKANFTGASYGRVQPFDPGIDPNHPSFLTAHLSLRFEVTDQEVLDRFCCRKGAKARWTQKKRPPFGELEYDNQGGYWYSAGSTLVDNPGANAIFWGTLAPDRDFFDFLYCENAVRGRDTRWHPSGHVPDYTGHRLIMVYAWSIRWDHQMKYSNGYSSDDRHAGSLSFDEFTESYSP